MLITQKFSELKKKLRANINPPIFIGGFIFALSSDRVSRFFTHA